MLCVNDDPTEIAIYFQANLLPGRLGVLTGAAKPPVLGSCEQLIFLAHKL